MVAVDAGKKAPTKGWRFPSLTAQRRGSYLKVGRYLVAGRFPITAYPHGSGSPNPLRT